MHKVDVKLFASLSEQLGFDKTVVEHFPGQTVAQVWAAVAKNQSVPSNLLCARNMEYCKLDAIVEQGDEIAFFPPVSGG